MKGSLEKTWEGVRCYACGKSPKILVNCLEHNRLECRNCNNEEKADPDEIAKKAAEVLRLLNEK